MLTSKQFNQSTMSEEDDMANQDARTDAPLMQDDATPEVRRKAARETTAGTPVRTVTPSTRPPRTTDATPELAHRMEPVTPVAPRPAEPAQTDATPSDGLEATRRAWLRALDAYEDGVLTYADYEERLADRTPLPWVATVVRAQADLQRQVLRASLRPARTLLGA